MNLCRVKIRPPLSYTVMFWDVPHPVLFFSSHCVVWSVWAAGFAWHCMSGWVDFTRFDPHSFTFSPATFALRPAASCSTQPDCAFCVCVCCLRLLSLSHSLSSVCLRWYFRWPPETHSGLSQPGPDAQRPSRQTGFRWLGFLPGQPCGQ